MCASRPRPRRWGGGAVVGARGVLQGLLAYNNTNI